MRPQSLRLSFLQVKVQRLPDSRFKAVIGRWLSARAALLPSYPLRHAQTPSTLCFRFWFQKNLAFQLIFRIKNTTNYQEGLGVLKGYPLYPPFWVITVSTSNLSWQILGPSRLSRWARSLQLLVAMPVQRVGASCISCSGSQLTLNSDRGRRVYPSILGGGEMIEDP